MDKIYFYDTGIRNYLIDNLKPLHLRTDSGSLGKFCDRRTAQTAVYNRKMVHSYFGAPTPGRIDYIEEEKMADGI